MNKLQVLPEEHVELKVLERTVKVGEPVIAPKHITENGEYSAKAEGVTGFDPVTVEVDMQPAVEAGYQKGYNDANEALDEEALLQEGLMQQISMALDGKTGTSGYDQGHEAGKQDEYDRFWDTYQQNGNRTNYNLAFGGAGWTDETFKPKYPIAPVGNAATENTFYASEITNIPDGLLGFSQVTYCYMTFRKSKLITSPPLDLSNCTQGTSWLFGQCANLKEIKTLKVSEEVTYDNLTYNCYALEKITFEGTIGKNISFQFNPLLTNESVQSIIDHLKDLTGATTQTLTFHATVGANLTDTQKAAISAKNWTLVY